MADAYGFLSWIFRNSERVERWEWGMSGPVDPRVGRDANKIHSKEILEFFIDVDLQSSVFFFFFLIRLILRRELIVYIGALLSAPPAFTSYFAFFPIPIDSVCPSPSGPAPITQRVNKTAVKSVRDKRRRNEKEKEKEIKRTAAENAMKCVSLRRVSRLCEMSITLTTSKKISCGFCIWKEKKRGGDTGSIGLMAACQCIKSKRLNPTLPTRLCGLPRCVTACHRL